MSRGLKWTRLFPVIMLLLGRYFMTTLMHWGCLYPWCDSGIGISFIFTRIKSNRCAKLISTSYGSKITYFLRRYTSSSSSLYDEASLTWMLMSLGWVESRTGRLVGWVESSPGAMPAGGRVWNAVALRRGVAVTWVAETCRRGRIRVWQPEEVKGRDCLPSCMNGCEW